MDLIYQNAELTIIAAIGDDPEYGLPGVRTRKRENRVLTTCAMIGKHFLISADGRPVSAAIAKGKWKTRGWTYQEAILSRRRLVFTEEQMYFECYGMSCCESLNFPLEELHKTDMQGFKSEFFSGNLVGMFPKGVGATSIEIVRRIEEYSKLNLSKPSDILKGMLGIFGAFHRGLGIQSFLGIPILPSNIERANKSMKGWSPIVGFILGLFWNIHERSKRRDGFPSWSWIGWHSPIE